MVASCGKPREDIGEIENKRVRIGMNEEKISMNGTPRIRARLIRRPPFFLLSFLRPDFVRPGFLLLSFLLLSFTLLARPLRGQGHSQEQTQQQPQQQSQVISINITRTIQAVNYRTKGSTRINFRGTALLPQGTGEAKIGNKSGA